MSALLSLLAISFLTALRFIGLPFFVVLLGFSVRWKAQRGAWIPLWKLALVYAGVLLAATLFFAVAWHDTAYP